MKYQISFFSVTSRASIIPSNNFHLECYDFTTNDLIKLKKTYIFRENHNHWSVPRFSLPQISLLQLKKVKEENISKINHRLGQLSSPFQFG